MGKITRISTTGGRQESRRAHLREVSGDFDIPLGTVGQELRGARISRGEDLDTVSRVLKIKKEHLEALEDDNISALPGRTYAVGFIRAYAEYLGLNPVDTAERFKTEIAGRHDPSKTAGFKEPEELPSGVSGGWIFIAVVVAGLLVYGVYYLFASSGSATQPQAAAVPPPPPSLTRQAPPPKPAPVARTATAVANNPSAGQAATQGLPPSAIQTAVQPQVYGKWNVNPRIVLRIKQPTHILVQDEKGTEFINKVLQPGDTYQVANRSGLSLTAEHGNAVEIDVDGKRVRMAGNSSDLATALPLDPDKLAGKSPGEEPPPSEQ